MNRRSIFVAISILAFVGAVGALIRGQYLDWEAARLEFASEHADAPTIDVAPKRDGWVLGEASPEIEATVKRNAVAHHRTLAAILAVVSLWAGYWAWAKCRPQIPAADMS